MIEYVIIFASEHADKVNTLLGREILGRPNIQWPFDLCRNILLTTEEELLIRIAVPEVELTKNFDVTPRSNT